MTPSPANADTEWIGGIVQVAPPRGMVRGPDVALWLVDGRVADVRTAPPRGGPRTLATGLRAALAIEGIPMPSSVRVAEPRAAGPLRTVLGADVPIVIAPTPELAPFARDLSQSLSAGVEAPGTMELLVLGDEDPSLVERFFTAAAMLYRAQPWTVLPSDAAVVGLDAPSLGLRGACASVIGRLGQSFGVLVFRSFDDYAVFQAVASRAHGTGHAARHVGSSFVAVNFEPVASLPATLRDAIARHRWELAGPSALPEVMPMSAEGEVLALEPADVRLATAACEALARLCAEHGAAIARDPSRSYTARYALALAGGGDVDVRYPHAALAGGLVVADDDDGEEEAATRAFCTAWIEAFTTRAGRDVRAARDEIERAYLGRRPTRNDRPPGLLDTSLPLLWAAFWRPTKDGRTGLELVARDALLGAAAWAGPRTRIEQARAVYGEAVALDRARGVLVLRDLYDGTRYRVSGASDAQLDSYHRWLRAFTVLVPRRDGGWTFPSVLFGDGSFADVAPARLLEQTRVALAAQGTPADDALAPHELLRRYAGIALAVLVREGARAHAAKGPARMYFTNSDGDRAEFHDVTVALRAKVAAVVARMNAAPDFVADDDALWDRFDPARNDLFPGGESIGQFAREDGRWRVSANSAARVERMFERLEQLLGERPREVSREVTAPWKTAQGGVDAPGEGVRTVVLASGRIDAATADEARAATGPLVMTRLRQQLDRGIPALGGTPRELVKTEAGRAEVEQWLREAEVLGLPAGTPQGRWIDLDPLRDELGLPTVGGATD